jgi:antirestriction protein ArdC
VSGDQAARVAELTGQVAAQVEALTDSENWRRMLDTAARFHRYSLNNILAITGQAAQRGVTPTRVAGYRTWTQLGRQVRTGEKGFAILAPCTHRKTTDDKTTDDADTGDADTGGGAGVGGRPDPGDRQQGRVLRGFRVVYVFDVSQTDGDELPDVSPVLLTGEADAALWDGLAAQVTGHGYTLQRGPCPGGSNGVTDPVGRTVRVRADVDPRQAVKTLAHELAHLQCGHTAAGSTYLDCRGTAEIEAESTAYVVLAASGVDTAAYTVPYVARWADGDTEAVRRAAATVTDAARRILDRLTSATGQIPAA